MIVVRHAITIVVGILLAATTGCGSGKSATELKAYESDHPLGPFEGTAGEFSTTDSGLKYRITRNGKGEPPTETDAVEVHYSGKLADGTEFDSSYKRQATVKFLLQQVITGWTEGLQLVAPGGQIDLIIPSKLGYGPNGQGPIPADATLYFTVELLDVLQPPDEPGQPGSKNKKGPEVATSPIETTLGPFADTEGDFSKTDSGLKYRITREGTGPKPKATDKVEVHYEGKLEDGKVFDSSYQRNESIQFPLNGVIPGWTEGMQLVGEGGKIDLIIPSNLGYGTGGTGPIPPNATLYFTVELLKIVTPQ